MRGLLAAAVLSVAGSAASASTIGEIDFGYVWQSALSDTHIAYALDQGETWADIDADLDRLLAPIYVTGLISEEGQNSLSRFGNSLSWDWEELDGFFTDDRDGGSCTWPVILSNDYDFDLASGVFSFFTVQFFDNGEWSGPGEDEFGACDVFPHDGAIERDDFDEGFWIRVGGAPEMPWASEPDVEEPALVPLPASVVFLGAALAGLGLMRRRAAF